MTQKPVSSYFLPWCSLFSLAPDSSAFPRRRRSTIAWKYRATLRDRASRLSVRVPRDFRVYGCIYCVFTALSLNKTVAFALQPWCSWRWVCFWPSAWLGHKLRLRYVRAGAGRPFKDVSCVGVDQRRPGVSNCFDAWGLSPLFLSFSFRLDAEVLWLIKTSV